jgi:hypothetical protein
VGAAVLVLGGLVALQSRLSRRGDTGDLTAA